jgi:hypothetical protein
LQEKRHKAVIIIQLRSEVHLKVQQETKLTGTKPYPLQFWDPRLRLKEEMNGKKLREGMDKSQCRKYHGGHFICEGL